jgi:hypothetical protein
MSKYANDKTEVKALDTSNTLSKEFAVYLNATHSHHPVCGCLNTLAGKIDKHCFGKSQHEKQACY